MTAEVISSIADVATGLASIVAVIIATIGLRTWQHEMRGRVNYDLARRILKATYKIRDTFERARQPIDLVLLHYMESSTDEKLSHFTEAFERDFGIFQESIRELNIEIEEAEVVWGPKLKTYLESIRHLSFLLESLMVDCFQNFSDSQEDENIKDVTRALSSGQKDEDPLRAEMTKIIEGLEREVRPYLGR
jgi:hypothetical protein